MRSASLLFLLACLMCTRASAQEAFCAELKAKSAPTLRHFLQEQQGARQSACLPSAIKQLGQIHDVKAIKLLVSYLDYLDPRTAPLPNGGATERPSYPAVTALFLIGKPATVELISAIEAQDSPEIRRNAIRAYADIYRDDLVSGIRALKTAELLAKSDDERGRLSQARRELMDECIARDENGAEACRSAATG